MAFLLNVWEFQKNPRNTRKYTKKYFRDFRGEKYLPKASRFSFVACALVAINFAEVLTDTGYITNINPKLENNK